MRTILSAAALVVLAATAAATEHHHFTGRSAIAAFYTSSGCVETSVLVSVDEEGSQTAPGQPVAAYRCSVHFEQWDSCNGQVMASGDVEADLAPDEVTLTPAARSATLRSTLEIFDQAQGRPATLALDLTWVATGPLYRSTAHDNYSSSSVHWVRRYRGQTRDAEASGSLLLDGTSLTAGPSHWAYVSTSQSAEVSIDRR